MSVGTLMSTGFKTTFEKLDDWDIYHRFLEQNPDVKERYEAHKTFEILKNDNGKR